LGRASGPPSTEAWLEALLSWVERQVLTGNTTPERIVTSAVKSLTAKGGPLDGAASLGEMVSGFLEGVNGLDSFVNTAFSHSLYCLFSQMRLLESELAEQPDLIVPRSLIILIICAKLGEWLNGLVKPSLLGHGGADRISLGYWRETVAKCGRMPIKSALEYVLTYLIVSQHFSVATRRFDGRTQRLRITVEEEGLVSLAGNYWQPSVTDDKLYSAVSLMSECGLVRFDRDDERVWVEN